jgi:hypothetical protein
MSTLATPQRPPPPVRRPFSRPVPLTDGQVASGEVFLTINEAAQRLGKSESWLRDRASQYGFRVGGEWRFHWPSIVAKFVKRIAA